MRTTRCVLGIMAAAWVFSRLTVPVAAHHAFAAEFDANKPITLTGTITKMEWVNPHSWMHLEVKDKDGKVQEWQVELGPPNALFRRGWTKDSVPAGTAAVIYGYLAKDGSMKVNGRDATFPDGRKLFIGTSGNGAPDFDEKK